MDLTRDQVRLLLLGAGIAVVAAGMVGASYLELFLANPPSGGLVQVHVRVDDATGHTLFSDEVAPEEANALAALRLAAHHGNFTVDVRETHEFTSVVGINGTETNDTMQWTYRWTRDGAAWCWGDRPAADLPLRNGDRVHWVWVERPAPTGGCGGG